MPSCSPPSPTRPQIAGRVYCNGGTQLSSQDFRGKENAGSWHQSVCVATKMSTALCAKTSTATEKRHSRCLPGSPFPRTQVSS
jgi:hypothetical protein